MQRVERTQTIGQKETSGRPHQLRLRGRQFFDTLGKGSGWNKRSERRETSRTRTVHDISYIQQLCELHDLAGDRQRSLLESYPGTLPTPLRGDPEYYDGAQFYMLNISKTLEEAGLSRQFLTPEQHTLLVSTNGLNDWWMDESFRREDGSRDYEKVLEAFNGINDVCYSFLNHTDTVKKPQREIKDSEIQRYVDYDRYALEQMPQEQRASLAKLLISINLYQGISLFQEKGFREYVHMGPAEFEPNSDTMAMLQRMQLEKGGIAFTYFWPYFPEITDNITIPDEPPTIEATIQHFLDGNSLYPANGMGKRILEIGEVNQKMDDSADCTLDLQRGVASPENVGVVYSDRAYETWDERVVRIKGELNNLKTKNDNEDHRLVVDAGVTAVDGLTLFRAYRSFSKKERTNQTEKSQAEFVEREYRYKLATLISEALDPSLRVVTSYVVATSPHVSYEKVDVFPAYGVVQKLDPRRRIANDVPILTLLTKRRARPDNGGDLLTDIRDMSSTGQYDLRDHQRGIKLLGGKEHMVAFELGAWIDGNETALRDIKEILRKGEIPQFASPEAFELDVLKTV